MLVRAQCSCALVSTRIQVDSCSKSSRPSTFVAGLNGFVTDFVTGVGERASLRGSSPFRKVTSVTARPSIGPCPNCACMRDLDTASISPGAGRRSSSCLPVATSNHSGGISRQPSGSQRNFRTARNPIHDSKTIAHSAAHQVSSEVFSEIRREVRGEIRSEIHSETHENNALPSRRSRQVVSLRRRALSRQRRRGRRIH